MDPTTADPDELIKQILGSGMYQPQMQQLQQRIAMGQGMLNTPGAQGAHVGQTYVASSPLEHLSVAIQRMIGAHMIGQGQAGERSAMDRVQQGRKSYADAILGASQTPQAPPDMIAAPGMDQASQEQAQQGKLRQLGLLGSLSGDPQMAQAGASAASMPGQQLAMAMERQKLASGKQEMEQEGPQAALGGLAPNAYALLTKRLETPKFVPAGQFPGSINARTGKFIPFTDAAGGPITDVHAQREREKRKAALNVGPDLEPSPDLMGKVENGLADPKSPGMEGPLKELAKLNSAAAGFADVAQQLRDFYGKHPNGALTGTDATKAEAIAQDLRSLYMQNLNMQTLRSSDIPILDKVISDPSSLKSMLMSRTGIRDLSAQLDTAVNLAKQRTLSQAASLGYQPTAKGRFSGFQQRTDQGGGVVTPPAAAAAPHPQDSEAVAWAKAHPGDPKAAAILKANGL